MHPLRRTVLAALLLTASALPAAAEPCSVTMGWEPWEPYQVEMADGRLTGLDVDLVNAMGKAAGCTVTWTKAPWARQLSEIEQGRLTGTPAASRTVEREVFGTYSVPYRTEAVHLVFPRGATTLGLKEVIAAGGKIGIVNGIAYGSEVGALLASPDTAAAFEAVSSDDLNLRKLAGGRIATMLADPYVATAKAKQLGLADRITVASRPVLADDIFLLFSRKGASAEVVEAFNRAIATIKADGTYDLILSRYMAGAGS